MITSSGLLIFAVVASLSGAVFLVALIELIFTTHRRRVSQKLEEQLHELKASYNEHLNKLVLSDDAELMQVEKANTEIASQAATERETLEAAHQAEIKELTKNAEAALDRAKEKAKKLEQEAKLQADEYLRNRKQEVEEELMDLVMHVTKKVLPKDMTYSTHKDLVLAALRDVRTSNEDEI